MPWRHSGRATPALRDTRHRHSVRINWQGIHLSEPKRCSDKPNHISCRHLLAALPAPAAWPARALLALRRMGGAGRQARDRGSLSSPLEPRLCAGRRTGNQHDAFSIAAWLAMDDRYGSLATFLRPRLSAPERTAAQVEGWILGVAGALGSSGTATMVEGRGAGDSLH